MNEVLIQLFVELISTHTGLHVRDRDREALCRKLWTRIEFLKLSSPEEYYQLLESGDSFLPHGSATPQEGLTPTQSQRNSLIFGGQYKVLIYPPTEVPILESELRLAERQTLPLGSDATIRDREWKELITLLTTGESYFFRDTGQFWLLKKAILPELIAHQRQVRFTEGTQKPSLRIWSAGCSTGEEPYSLAILLKELIPDWESWNIFILGTDINQEFIQKAQQGIYSSWSFRIVNAEQQRAYFQQRKHKWEINEQIRIAVTFRELNLVKDNFPCPSSNIYNMDLILCRNVFVYFDAQAISVVLEKFYKTLKPGGYLMTAHAELHGQQLGLWRSKVFPESAIYQRSQDSQVDIALGRDSARGAIGALPREKGVAKPLSPTVLQTFNFTPPATPQALARAEAITAKTADSVFSPTVTSIFNEAETLFQKEAYTEAIKKAEQAIALHPRHFGAYYLLAQVYANLGDYQKAEESCHRALEIDSLSVYPYYLLAHIAEEQGQLEKAKSLFKRIIYLEPLSIYAYVELAAIYEMEGNLERARKMRTTALEIIKELPPDSRVERHGELTAGEVQIYLKKMLRK